MSKKNEDILALEDGADTKFRNVGAKLNIPEDDIIQVDPSVYMLQSA
jgi:hypothetical protein